MLFFGVFFYLFVSRPSALPPHQVFIKATVEKKVSMQKCFSSPFLATFICAEALEGMSSRCVCVQGSKQWSLSPELTNNTPFPPPPPIAHYNPTLNCTSKFYIYCKSSLTCSGVLESYQGSPSPNFFSFFPVSNPSFNLQTGRVSSRATFSSPTPPIAIPPYLLSLLERGFDE